MTVHFEPVYAGLLKDGGMKVVEPPLTVARDGDVVFRVQAVLPQASLALLGATEYDDVVRTRKTLDEIPVHLLSVNVVQRYVAAHAEHIIYRMLLLGHLLPPYSASTETLTGITRPSNRGGQDVTRTTAFFNHFWLCHRGGIEDLTTRVCRMAIFFRKVEEQVHLDVATVANGRSGEAARRRNPVV